MLNVTRFALLIVFMSIGAIMFYEQILTPGSTFITLFLVVFISIVLSNLIIALMKKYAALAVRDLELRNPK